MILKSIKTVVIGGVAVALGAGIMFGTDAGSYIRSSYYGIRDSVKDSVPIEFEIRRAHDLLNDIMPEMHANIRLIAQQEVEVATLKKEIEHARRSLSDEQAGVQKLRTMLTSDVGTFRIQNVSYSRDEMAEELSRRFDRYKEGEVVLASKQKLLSAREKGLRAAISMLEKTRSQKAVLESQVAALESQFRLIQAAGKGSKGVNFDNSKLAQTQKVLNQIKKQLDISERVLAHEARFVQSVPVDVVNEKDLVASIDEHFGTEKNADKAEVEVRARAERH